MFKAEIQENEKIIKVYRQTKIVLFKYVFLVFLGILVPWRFLSNYGLSEKFSQGLWIWTLLCIFYFFHRYMLWRLNSYILTDKRLINLQFYNTVHKRVIETPLDRILNISFETKGIFPAIFNYGDIYVQIVGLTEPLVFSKISRPAKTKDYLWKIHNEITGQNPYITKESLPDIQKKIGYQTNSSTED